MIHSHMFCKIFFQITITLPTIPINYFINFNISKNNILQFQLIAQSDRRYKNLSVNSIYCPKIPSLPQLFNFCYISFSRIYFRLFNKIIISSKKQCAYIFNEILALLHLFKITDNFCFEIPLITHIKFNNTLFENKFKPFI